MEVVKTQEKLVKWVKRSANLELFRRKTSAKVSLLQL